MINHSQRLKLLYATGGLAAVVLLIIFGTAVHSAALNRQTATPVAQIPAINPFDHINLQAKSAIVYDVEKKEIVYSRAGEAQLPLASLTKVMTALVASRLLPPATTIEINQAALATEGDSDFSEGEEWQLTPLLDYVLVTSSNDGAAALALSTERLTGQNFVASMNATAQSLGLTQTFYRNETGLDLGPSQPGAYGSAHDTAKLFAHLLEYKPDLLTSTVRANIVASSYTRAYHGQNTNTLASVLPGVMGSKTGYTDLAGGNLAMVVDAGLRQPYIIVVLGSTQEGRFNDLRILSTALNAWVTNQ